MRADPRQRLLDDVALGELGPVDAFSLVRELLDEDARKFSRRIYIVLQAVARRVLSSVRPPADMSSWSDVFGRASSLMLRAGASEDGYRVSALVDLIELAASFDDMQPIEEVVRRRHHTELLQLLAENNGALGRLEVLDRLKLGQSNLSRILTSLEGHGLVRREKAGREARLHLTDAGKAELDRLQDGRVAVPLEALFGKAKIGMTASRDDGTTVANEWLLRTAGSFAWDSFDASRKGTSYEDVAIDHDRWLRRIEVGQAGEADVAIWLDVSDLKLAESNALKRVVMLEAKNAALKTEIAETRLEAAYATSRFHHQGLVVDAVREGVVGRLTSAAHEIASCVFDTTEPVINQVDSPAAKIVEITDAFNRFLAAPSRSKYGWVDLGHQGRSYFRKFIHDIGVISNTKIEVDIPEWIDGVQADLGEAWQPLVVALSQSNGHVSMEIQRHDDKIEFRGVGIAPHRDLKAGSIFRSKTRDWEAWGHGVQAHMPSSHPTSGNAVFVVRLVSGGGGGAHEPKRRSVDFLDD